MQQSTSSSHVILSGCSGGGKSTLLEELKHHGFQTVPEPGRRIVESEMRAEGTALPWVNLEAFSRRAIKMASRDRRCMTASRGWVFFDRGLVDAALALEHATGEPVARTLDREDRYHQQVFMTPPWPEIFLTDSERKHSLTEAIAEYDRLIALYSALGYETILLPKIDVVARADFLMTRLR